MPIYLVERILPGASVEALEAIKEAAEKACRGFAANDRPIRYLRSTCTPGESRCRCLFEAANGDLVRNLNDQAQLPHSRIIVGLELPVESGSRTKRECFQPLHTRVMKEKHSES